MKNILTKGIENFFQSPLYMASEKGDLKLVQFILDQELESSWGQNNHQNGKTPIHIAAMNGHVDILKFLVSFTDDPNIPGRFGASIWTPIFFAADIGNIDILKFLAPLTKNPNGGKSHGKTPIQWAQSKGHDEFARLLQSFINTGHF